MKQIAIDGPAGAGKSTIAKQLSKDLGYVYIDTGAMYRTIALYCLKKEADLDDEELISALCSEAEIDIRYLDGVQHMFLGEEDVSEAIRTEQVSQAASAVSKYPKVRMRLVEMQRELAKQYDVVMDGRDIGTHVLPDASLKIYLTASVDVRAERRYKEYLAKGLPCDLEEMKKDIAERDHNGNIHHLEKRRMPLKWTLQTCRSRKLFQRSGSLSNECDLSGDRRFLFWRGKSDQSCP